MNLLTNYYIIQITIRLSIVFVIGFYIQTLFVSSISQSLPTDSPEHQKSASSQLISRGSTWKYLDDGSNQGTVWRTVAYNDSLWASGSAQLGYGDGDETTIVNYGPDANNKYITTYFRHTFTITQPTLYKNLQLNILRDDGAIVYLNGTEVFSTNMPSTSINYLTLASVAVAPAQESAYFTTIIDAKHLITGTNVIAVEVHQANSSSSDISFDLELGPDSNCGILTTHFAVIGDFGQAGQPELDVSNLVKSWNPDFIITLGDNNYNVGSAATIDANIGQYYHQFIGNYVGAYGAGAVTNKFYPALGNHDWYSTAPALPQPYLDYFTLPGNERYYNFTEGPIEFFAIDSDPNEPDGISDTSIQANWLKTQLAASIAPWKLVYMHHALYSSSLHGPNSTMQWPYQTWGATAVLAGHDHTYERIIHNNFPYFVNGLGGKSIRSFNTPIPSSVARYNGDYGAMLVQANDTCLIFEFISRTDQLIDTYIIPSPYALYLPLILKN